MRNTQYNYLFKKAREKIRIFILAIKSTLLLQLALVWLDCIINTTTTSYTINL